jgi:hypothetical protein
VDTSGQVGGDDDTQDRPCALCAARAHVDTALVRAGAERITLVVEYSRALVGRGVTESAKAFVSLGGDKIVRGDGHSREEALVNALEHAGVSL